MMMPKSLYGRRRVDGLPYPSSTRESYVFLKPSGSFCAMPMYSSSSHVAPSSRDTFTRYALWPSVVGTWTYA